MAFVIASWINDGAIFSLRMGVLYILTIQDTISTSKARAWKAMVSEMPIVLYVNVWF